MKKIYNMSETMMRAWAIRKAAAADMGCKVSEVLMGECLKIAWAEAEGANAETNAAAIAGEWANMADADKMRMMTACIRKAAKNEIGYSTEDHYLQFSEVPAFGCFRTHDFDEFVSETCIRVLDKLADLVSLSATNERRAAHRKRPMRLVSGVYNAARASIAAVYYADSKHGAAYDWEINDGEGNVLLSHKNVESKKMWDTLTQDEHISEKVFEGVGKEVVKGGLIATIEGVRAFVPASQLSTKYVEKIEDMVG